MNLVEFLRECGTFFVLTSADNSPMGRPFGAVMEHDGDLYISTANTKQVYQQLKSNPSMQIVAIKHGTRTWVRISGSAEECTERDIKAKMLDECPGLLRHYCNADVPHYAVFKINISNSEIVES